MRKFWNFGIGKLGNFKVVKLFFWEANVGGGFEKKKSERKM